MIERICSSREILAIIIRSDFSKEGIKFFTPADFAQQLAYMNRPGACKIRMRRAG